MSEYDVLASIYEIWSEGDPAYLPSHDFYVHICSHTQGNVVELGVGTGRIAVDIARFGSFVTGIDISSVMLKHCLAKAKDAGIDKYIRLIQSDVREFTLSQKSDLIIFPFRSIGHLLTLDDKKAALNRIYDNLNPGGSLIFDHYVFDVQWALAHNGIPRLMYSSMESDQEGLFIWDIYKYDLSAQVMRCFIIVEKTDAAGHVISKSYNPLSFSWILPEQVRTLAEEVGFVVQDLYGDFKCGAFNEESCEQIWRLRRPE